MSRPTAARLFLLVFMALLADRPLAAGEPVDFNRDIRPLLSDTCYQCHGPDSDQREADLRLDQRDQVLGERDGRALVVPRAADASELYRRITSQDESERMPPPDSGRQLTADQIDLVRRWITEGAAWQQHWAFEPPKRPALPTVRQRDWPRNPIDHFILNRLEQEKLRPSPEADRATLLRRVTLDLTGLPPTAEELAAFIADDSADAYERAVDRLLASPHYGERMGAIWLDAARYADTSGYQTDGERFMWRWRDWVIDSFNRNQPYDQFTVEQLAGDLLPTASLDQLIATGFNRNHRANSEGGIVDEEYLVEYAVDRVDTTFTVWLGLTVGCARCHDHKYDPISQKEFYQLLAYFNNIPERGRVFKYGNTAPVVKAPTDRMRRQLAELDARLADCRQEFAARREAIAAEQREWEAAASISQAADWTVTDALALHLSMDGNLQDSAQRHETISQGGLLDFASGRHGKAARFTGTEAPVEVQDFQPLDGRDPLTIAAWIYPESPDGTIVALMDDGDSRDKGLSWHLSGGRLQLNFGPRWLDDALRLQTVARLPPDRWSHIALAYDGSHLAEGVRLYIDGQRQETETLLDKFTGTFAAPAPLRIGARGTDDQFRGRVDELQVFRRALDAYELAAISCGETIAELLKLPPQGRSERQRAKLRGCFLEREAPEDIRQLRQQLVQLQRQRDALQESVPTTMVMQERETQRPTHVLLRGEYDKPGERVERAVPAALSPTSGARVPDRMALANWIVDADNPLTARVAVNRYWQMHFGSGLVRTPEDFGSQGQRPTHPELLDWLATTFVRSGWNVKAMQRLIVTSATYRQASRADQQLLKRDPDNRLLARATRLRLPAETVRDQALAASRLLVRQLGGPSVRPYQPDGLWKEIASDEYHQDHGSKLYRRSLYTFWKRTVPPPTMSTFDAGSREACTVDRSRTNTPLQALALLNDVTYVEAARALAQQMLTHADKLSRRLQFGFVSIVGRSPSDEEIDVLQRGYARYLQRYQQDERAAADLLAVGESPVTGDASTAELAAMTAVASILLNLDETITRP